MNQPIDGCDSDGFVGEDFIPGAERLIGSDGEASIFVASGDEFEENGAFCMVFLSVCDVDQPAHDRETRARNRVKSLPIFREIRRPAAS